MSQSLYTLYGTVVHGKGKGRTVGMPTANLAVYPNQDLPPSGVYATAVQVDGQRYQGVTNVGTRPSVDCDQTVTIETFLFHYSGNLYGKEMAVQFLCYLRPVKAFSSLQAVKDQVERDCAAAAAYFRERE